MENHYLSETEVKRIINDYESEHITDQLLDFGRLMLDEIQDRSSKINAHAIMVLGWATGTLAVLFSQLDKFSGIAAYPVLGSSVFAFAAVVYSFLALKTTKEWTWPSDKSWMHQNSLRSADELKRYYVRVIHGVRKRHAIITEDQASSLFWAEIAIAVAGLLLFVGAICQILFTKFSWVLASSKGV